MGVGGAIKTRAYVASIIVSGCLLSRRSGPRYRCSSRAGRGRWSGPALPSHNVTLRILVQVVCRVRCLPVVRLKSGEISTTILEDALIAWVRDVGIHDVQPAADHLAVTIISI